MDENNDVNRLDTVLGVREDKSAGSKIKNFTKKVERVPDKKEVVLESRADFRKANKELTKKLKVWERASRFHAGNPLINYFFGDKHKLKATKRMFAELENAAFKSSRKYNSELNGILGTNREQNKGLGFKYEGDIGDTRKAFQNNLKQRILDTEQLKTLQKEYNTLLEKQKQLSLLPDEEEANKRKIDAQTELNAEKLKRNKAHKNSMDGVIGKGQIKLGMDQGAEWNKEVSKLAAGYYARTNGDETLFNTVRSAIEGSTNENKKILAEATKNLNNAKKRQDSWKNKLAALQTKNKNNPTEDTEKKINEAKLKLDKASDDVHFYSDERKRAKVLTDLDKKRQAQFKQYYKNKDKPQDFAKDQVGFKTEQFAPKVDARLRDITKSYKGLVEAMKTLTSSKELADADTKVQQAIDNVQRAEALAKNTRKQSDVDSINKQLSDKNKQIKDTEKNIQKEKQEGKHLLNIFNKLHQKAKNIGEEMRKWDTDLSVDPFQYKLNAGDLQQYNDRIQDITDGTSSILTNWRKSNVLSRLWSRTLINIRSQISDMFNPFTKFRMGFDAWLNRWDNLPWKNTFDVIAYNFTTVFAPIFEWLAKAIIVITQYLNVFIQRWAGINLFDKSAWQLEQIKKGVGQLTASFDELHSNNDNPNQFNTIFDTDPSKITPLDDALVKKLEGVADGLKKVWDGVIGFIKDHPIISAILGGLTMLFGPSLFGMLGKLVFSGVKGLAKLAWNGIAWLGPKIWTGVKWVAGKIVDPTTWSNVGTFFKGLGTKLGSTFGTTMGTVIKGGAGAAIAVGGNIMIHDGVKNLTKYWDTMSGGEKALRGLESAGGLAASTLGGAMLGSVIPGIGTGIGAIIGFTVGATNAIVTWGTTAPDNILSVEDATKQYNATLEYQAELQGILTEAVGTAASTMEYLEQIERETGISGEALNAAVENGTISVYEMDAAQLKVYQAYLNNKTAIENLKKIEEEKQKTDKQAVKNALEVELANAKETKSYDTLKKKVTEAMDQGKIDITEARDIYERAMGDMSDDARKTFMEDLPDAVKNGLDENKYSSTFRKFGNNFKSMMEDLGSWFSKKWEGLSNWWNSLWNKNTPNTNNNTSSIESQREQAQKEIESIQNNPNFTTQEKNKLINDIKNRIPQYAIGTNYVPNDGLAYIHKGEAVIPAKYNKPYTPNNNSNLESTISAMTHEISNLRGLIQGGIPVKGEFKQRGSDLIAVVEKGRTRNGNQPLSNPAYAR